MDRTPTRPDTPLPVLLIGIVLVLLLAAVILQWIIGVVLGLVRLVLLLVLLAGLAWVGLRLVAGRSR